MRDVLHRIASDTIAVCRALICWYLDHDWSGWKDKPRTEYGGPGPSITVTLLPSTYQDRLCWRCGKYEERRKPPPTHYNCRCNDELMLGLQPQTND